MTSWLVLDGPARHRAVSGDARVFDTEFTGAVDNNWSTEGNWTAGKPTALEGAAIASSVASLIINEAAACLSLDTTGTGGVTVSGTSALTVSGNFTLDTATTWTNSGILSFSTNPAIIKTAGKSLGSAASVHIKAACDAVLDGAINTGTKALYVYGAGSSFDSANNQIDCGIFGDNATVGAVSLTLGTSTINCTIVSFGSSTLTVTSNTAAVTMAGVGTDNIYFGGKVWGGSVSIGVKAYAFIRDTNNTFGNLTVNFSTLTDSGAISFRGAQTTVSGNFNIISYKTAQTGSSKANCPIIDSSYYQRGAPSTITVNGSVTITGNVDFKDITGAGTASWNLSALPIGNCGGNSGITFPSPKTLYLVAGAASSQIYDNVFSTTSGGSVSSSNIPHPQDTIIIDNNSWSGTGYSFLFHSGTRSGIVNASGLTTSGNTINFPRQAFGSVDYSGAGVTINTTGPGFEVIDASLMAEGSLPLLLNIPQTLSVPNFTIGNAVWAASAALQGVVKLATNWGSLGTLTFNAGELDLNGKTLTAKVISSSLAKYRTIKDTAGGSKIVLTGVTGTIFDTTTATNFSVSNAPDITIGTSNQTLTGDVTFKGAGKVYGDLLIAKHAGNFQALVTGANTFASVTQETVDGTYPYNGVTIS